MISILSFVTTARYMNCYLDRWVIVPLCCSGQEYDIYGFVKKYDYESGEFDPVTLEAQKLERRSTEVNDKVKVKPSTLNTV